MAHYVNAWVVCRVNAHIYMCMFRSTIFCFVLSCTIIFFYIVFSFESVVVFNFSFFPLLHGVYVWRKFNLFCHCREVVDAVVVVLLFFFAVLPTISIAFFLYSLCDKYIFLTFSLLFFFFFNDWHKQRTLRTYER